MSSGCHFPLAPRPRADELLSSWQRRVACRYELSGDDVSLWLSVVPKGRHLTFEERDFAPSSKVIQAWAEKCRLPEAQIGALALETLPRPKGLYVWDDQRSFLRTSTPFCSKCLDEDTSAGRDHYYRRCWSHAERFRCDLHNIRLHDSCLVCNRGAAFEFTCLDGLARLACQHCGCLASSLPCAEETSGEGVQALTKAVSQEIEGSSAGAKRVAETARLLWKTPHLRTGRKLPLVADVIFPSISLTPSARVQTDPAEPLATAPIGWRLVTLIGVAKMLGIGGRELDLSHVAVSIEKVRAWTDEDPPRTISRHAQEEDADGWEHRSDSEYLEMAKNILASERWLAVREKDKRTQAEVMEVLMDQALAITI